MNEAIQKDYERLKAFWNDAFLMTEEDRKQAAEDVNPEEDWKALAPSEKLLRAACALGTRKHVLDYGCGSGWAGIAAAKGGCAHVLCADVAASGAERARFYAELLQVSDRIECKCISTDWLSKEADASYDGFICSNVLDVIPTEAAEEILCHAARVLTADADAVIGLNYYIMPKEDASRHITVQYGNYIYIDGILRMVSRTDEEWTALLERYFTVAGLEHFAWPGEKNETRRLFRLRKKA